MRLRSKSIAIATGVAVAVSALAGCSAPAADPTHIKVAFWSGSDPSLKDFLGGVAAELEEADSDITVELVPVAGTADDYKSKLQLMARTESTAPDVIYEDSFLVKSDAAAGYLAPLDDYVAEWDDWSLFSEGVQEAGAGEDGKIYGISAGTDLRAIWYNKDILSAAGLETPWQPETWQDILDAAEAVAATSPDVIPLNLYAGKAAGEASSIQGFQMLLSGTDDWLVDDGGKWVLGSQGFRDALQFVEDVYQNDLGPSPQLTSSADYKGQISNQLLPEGKLAIAIDGSWMPTTWVEGGAAPWPGWEDTMGVAAMPTQNGQEPGTTAMSGGWLLSMGAKSTAKDLAWRYISTALNQENSAKLAEALVITGARSDVSPSEEYLAKNPTADFFSELVATTHFRPATEDYPRISSEIQVATEEVITGSATVEDAARRWDDTVTKIVGDENTVKG
ncbi:extracellular solute-binding protein [Homoserinibacter sp. YIM 151385]|uniref:extracellular solute-binding protein n=1 Tax=Homoserinibacter sp. YIM 151385 TaxID=2985506 RepID=UPI0022F017B9|nr:extracellular solute-binding protein [Homoserinibacter sp. YIM 151385]WBU37531.1 extracellular solute-binding protein [Homoserinibacter sp. YIM 151385]